MSNENTIRWERDGDVVVLVLDHPGQSANVMNEDYRRSMGEVVARLEAEKDTYAGVIITSAKKTFFAGGDLNWLLAARREDAAQITELVTDIKRQLRRLEKLGKPVVAAVNGTALGGGLELALAAHHRVLLDAPGVELGFPEVTLGLLPGGGGVTRVVRMLGLTTALMAVLLQGQRFRPADARSTGLVDDLGSTPEELMAKAKAWIAANPSPAQPWDKVGYKLPGGAPSDPSMAMILPAAPANLRKQLKGANYPAPKAILAAAVEGAQVDFDTALAVEGRWFVSLVVGQESKSMIQALFFDMAEAKGARGRPADVPVFKPTKVVVLGAGMMGAAIAYVCAKAGIEVVLRDVSLEAAEKGKAYSAGLLDKAISRGRSTAEKKAALLARITPTAEAADAAGADLLIEAVFEDPKVKAAVFAEIEPHLAPDALLGSNTSTLPITGLAQGVSRPADFVGLHFFSPVDKMPLLEIIRGEETTDATLYRALDVARAIGKTPIVVNDSRGFFTSRVIGTFLDEGIAMLSEGIPAPSIEQASAQAGYPAPVLQLADELNLGLMRKIKAETKAAAEAEGRAWTDIGSGTVIDRMIDEFNRPAKVAGAGFYEYVDGKRTRLWPGLADAFGGTNTDIGLEDLKERMLFAEALETVHCFDEGVLTSVADANVGSIIGIGYPAWTGGVIGYVNGYEGGTVGFVARARELAKRYGPRFDPPASLVECAEAGKGFAP